MRIKFICSVVEVVAVVAVVVVVRVVTALLDYCNTGRAWAVREYRDDRAFL